MQEKLYLEKAAFLCQRQPVIMQSLWLSFQQGITPFLAAEIHDGAFKPAANPKKYRLQDLPEIDAPQN